MKSIITSTVMACLFITGAAFAQSASIPSSAPDRAARMQHKFDSHFAKADKNGDGFIDHDEAAGNRWLTQNFDAIDINKDGKISKEEMQAYQSTARTTAHEKFEAKFKAADTNGDGALSKEEAEAAKLPHIVKNFDAIDNNKDGKVTSEELRAFMISQHKERASAK